MQQKTKEEMHQFYTAKEVWKAKERLLMQQEDDKIKQINEEKEKAKEKGKLESILKAKIRDQISDNLLKQHKEMMVGSYLGFFSDFFLSTFSILFK